MSRNKSPVEIRNELLSALIISRLARSDAAGNPEILEELPWKCPPTKKEYDAGLEIFIGNLLNEETTCAVALE